MKNQMKVLGIFAMVITFALTGLVSCIEGGSLEVKNDHTAVATVSVFFESEEITTKDIDPGKTETWTFSKDGGVYYTYRFADDYNFDGSVGQTALRVLVMGGDVTKVTIRP